MDELEQLEGRHKAEQSKLNELITVGQAENVVSTARQDELHEQQRAARRRLAAARGLLTKAQRDGSAERIAAARARVDARQRGVRPDLRSSDRGCCCWRRRATSSCSTSIG